MRETWVLSLGWEDPLEEGMTTHSSIFAWKVPMDRGAWCTTVHRVAKSWPELKQFITHAQRKFTFEKLKDQWKSWISGIQELTQIMVLNCKHHISCLRPFQITFYTNHFWKYQLGTCVIWLKITSKILLYVWPSDQDFSDRQSLGTSFDTHERANLNVYGGNTFRATVDQWRIGGLLG